MTRKTVYSAALVAVVAGKLQSSTFIGCRLNVSLMSNSDGHDGRVCRRAELDLFLGHPQDGRPCLRSIRTAPAVYFDVIGGGQMRAISRPDEV